MSDIDIIRNYIIACAILLTPIILVIGGVVLRKSKKKISTWLLIAGGLCIGLLALAPILFTLLNFVNA